MIRSGKTINRLVALIAVVLMAACGQIPVRMEGTSMRPTLDDGDRLLIERSFEEIARGDILRFRYPLDETKFFIKRAVGLPGEKIRIENGIVFINGNALDEPYVDQQTNRSRPNMDEKTIGSDQYFVLGDNRDNSSDSRAWGTVERRLIDGKYRLTYARSGK